MANASSNLGLITVGGTAISLPSSGALDTIPLNGLLGPIGSITLNQKTQTTTSNTEDLIDVHLNGLADVVVGEAQVTQPGGSAAPCANTPTPIPNPPGPNPPGLGGVGSDVIKVGTGHDTVIGGAGNNRITARGRFAHVSAGKGKSIAYVRKANRAYAHKHGVKKVNVLA